MSADAAPEPATPAIHSLYRFAALRHPEHAATIQRVLAIPPKRYERALVTFLAEEEVDALLDTPDRTTWIGRRDHTLLLLAIQTGLRAAELTGLRRCDIHLGRGPHVSCRGKGRKQRITPLTAATVAVLRACLKERSGETTDPLLRHAPAKRSPMTRSRARSTSTQPQPPSANHR